MIFNLLCIFLFGAKDLDDQIIYNYIKRQKKIHRHLKNRRMYFLNSKNTSRNAQRRYVRDAWIRKLGK